MNQPMPSFSALQESCESGWPRGGGSLQGFRWGANSLTRGIWMWSHPFLLGKDGKKVRERKDRGSQNWVRQGEGKRDREQRWVEWRRMEKENFGVKTRRQGGQRYLRQS